MSRTRLFGRVATVGAATIAVVAVMSAGAFGRGVTTQPSLSEGLTLFTSTGCSACHTFKNARATGKIGPNLDNVKLTVVQLTTQITKGGCAVMTKAQCSTYKFSMSAFKGRLTTAQIADVASYVFTDRDKAPAPGTATTTTSTTTTSKTSTTSTTGATTTTTTTATTGGGGAATTTAGAGGPPYNEADSACPPGQTIQTGGNTDADGDELAQEPNDGDGCI